MTRNRKLKEGDRPHKHKEQAEHGKKKHFKSSKDDYYSVLSTLGVGFIFILLIFGGVQFWSYLRIARLYSPLNEPKMSIDSEEDVSRLWGSYR